MTKNTIDYITKKQFRSLLNVIVVLVTAAVAALSSYLSVRNGFHPALAAFACFAVLAALFSFVSLFSPGKGCTLMRMAVSVNAVVCFFSGMGSFTLGYLFIRQSGTQERINELFADLGFGSIVTQPKTTGILLFAASVILYLASGCAFFGHRFLGAARSCSEGTLKRSGFRVFPLLAFILFFTVSGAAAVFFLLSDKSYIDRISSDIDSILVVVLFALLLVHLLLSGLCARAFARKTFAFKVFEKQIMKVETNADGTVYVPINEDKGPDEKESLTPAKKAKDDGEKNTRKQFIQEFAPSPHDAAQHIEHAEGDII